ncbi:MAG: serine acetyltransferase [Maribacter arcticus]|uniref:serine O-acetyltransferase n=1 Tax=Maribacter arcticus TaxID=561365 RepID=UPI003002163A
MINSRRDYNYYLKADRIAKALPLKPTGLFLIKQFFFPDKIWDFQKALRKYEFYKNCKTQIWWLPKRLLVYRRYRKLSLQLGFTIPPNVCGPGLSIAHIGTIVINGNSKIGANCRLHVGVNIGTAAGYSDKAPEIGDNCYLGPGVKLFGEIKVADCTVIGANAVVAKDIVEKSTVVVGAPARKIKNTNVFDVLIPATLIMERGLHDKHDLQSISAKALNEKYKF